MRSQTLSPKILGMLVARQGSSRLPGKALVDVCGKPMIGHILDRLRGTRSITQVVVATSTRPEDQPIVDYARSIGIETFKGDPDDVLSRITQAAQYFDADAVVEVGGDCPFVDPTLLEQGIQLYSDTQADLVTNALVPPYTFPVGYDFILVRRDALERANREATLISERHQPFYYITKNPDKFTVRSFAHEKNLNHWRWTLDYAEDLELVRQVYLRLQNKPLFGFNEIHELLQKDPQLVQINAKWAEPVTGPTVWFTGSYVKEAHRDIRDSLECALNEENERHFSIALQQYERARCLLDDLIKRSRHLSSQSSSSGQ